jgi:hypothetical protein
VTMSMSMYEHIARCSARLLVVGALVLPLGACKEATQALRDQIGERLQARLTPDDAPEPSGAPLPPELVANKLILYVDCVNTSRVPLYAGFRQVSTAEFAGPKKARPADIDPVLDESLESCSKAQREGPLLQPPLPALEAAAATYLARARELAAAVAAVRADLAEKPGPRDPEATDPRTRFAAAFTRWDQSRQALDEEIDARQAEVDAAVLAEVERRGGKGLEWHARDLMRAARPYVRCLGDHDEITAKICAGYFTPFDQAYQAFMAVHAADPDANKVFWMPQFVASLGQYHRSADALRVALHDNTAKAGDIGAVAREYNDLIRDFTALNFTAVGSP